MVIKLCQSGYSRSFKLFSICKMLSLIVPWFMYDAMHLETSFLNKISLTCLISEIIKRQKLKKNFPNKTQRTVHTLKKKSVFESRHFSFHAEQIEKTVVFLAIVAKTYTDYFSKKLLIFNQQTSGSSYDCEKHLNRQVKICSQTKYPFTVDMTYSWRKEFWEAFRAYKTLVM